MIDSIPCIDAGALLGPESPRRALADRALMEAAADTGFFLATRFPADIPVDARTRAALLRIFALPDAEIRGLWRRKFDPEHPNIYRGWFPLQPGFPTSKEGIDLGPDVAHGAAVVQGGDPLREATPLPSAQVLPGWREAVASYYLAMEDLSRALMRAIARGLGVPEQFFDGAFAHGGSSTLRLIRYPVRTDAHVWITHRGERRCIVGVPHVDSGFLTLLAQDGVDGLQAQHRDGRWIDVPPVEGALAVNFGQVLERWCGGRIKATRHRVLGGGRERMSIPFFYEARADAEIAPLPIPGAAPFEPFFYGDYLWATTTQFVEFMGMEKLRPPLRRCESATDGG